MSYTDRPGIIIIGPVMHSTISEFCENTNITL